MRRLAMLGAGVLVLSAGALLAAHAPALYDGIGFPDEPYRYSQVLADDPVKTPPPTTASATLTIGANTNLEGTVLTSGESGPQLLAYIPKAAVRTTGDQQTVRIAATPLAPDLPKPADGPIAGDIYRMATATPATWEHGTMGTISLRSPQGIPVAPTMEFRAPGKALWQPLTTTRVGNDIWEAPLQDLGDYALVLPVHPAKPATRSNTTVYLLAAGVAAIAVLLIVVRLALRRRRDPAT